MVARADPRLVLTRARLRGRRLTVGGRLAQEAAGRVTVRVRAKGRTRLRGSAVMTGKFRTRVRLPKGAKRVRVVARYSVDRAYRPATVRRLIERSSAA